MTDIRAREALELTGLIPLSARLAQSAERKALNLVVVGSSPTVGVAFYFCVCVAVSKTSANVTYAYDSSMIAQATKATGQARQI